MFDTMENKRKYNFIYCIIACFLSLSVFGQEEFKSRNDIGVAMQLSKKWDLGLNQNYRFDTQPYELGSLQQSISLGYNFKKKWSLGFSYKHNTKFRKEKDNKTKYRLVAGASYSHDIGDWELSSKVKVEYFSKEEEDYRFRVVQVFKLKAPNDLLVPSVKLSPYFISYLYYNIGGDKIKQYDNHGESMGKHVPFGWHRLRLGGGLSMKPFKNIGIYGEIVRQQEFNTDFASYNKINVYNPKKDKYNRPFENNYIVEFGLKYYVNSKKVRKKFKSYKKMRSPNFKREKASKENTMAVDNN